MKAQSLFDGLRKLFGLTAIVLSMWTAMLTAFFVGKSVAILIHADGYRPAVCTVDRLFFSKGEMRRNRTYDEHYAVVTIEGRKEEFSLGGYVKGPVQSRADLEAQVHVGQTLAVLYNPDVPENGRLRVLFPEQNFKETWQHRRKKMVNTAYGPWILAMVLCLVSGAAARKLKPAIKMCVGACVFVAFAWIPFLAQNFF